MSENFLLREIGAEVQVEWRIERFLSLTVEEWFYLHSPAFPLSDAQWFLSIWPFDNSKDNPDGWICLYLQKRFSTSKIHALKYTLGFRKGDGSVYKPVDSEYRFQEFTGYPMDQFVRVSELRQSENVLTADGTLTVFATVRLAEPNALDKVEIVNIPRELPFRVMHTEEVSSEWKVEGFTSLPKDQDDFSLKSPTFSLAGARWCMKVYPNGYYVDTPGWVALYLCRECSPSEKQTVAFTLGIQKQDGTPHRVAHYEEEYNTKTLSGCYCLLKSSELLDSDDEHVREGCVTFFCTARVISSPLATAAVMEGGGLPSSNPSHNERDGRMDINKAKSFK